MLSNYPDDYSAYDRRLEDLADARWHSAEIYAAAEARHFLHAPTIAQVTDYLDLGDGPSFETLAAFLIEEHRAGNPRAYSIMHALSQKLEEYRIAEIVEELES